MVDDPGARAPRGPEAQRAARHEGSVADVRTGRDQPCDIHPGILAEDDAVAVDQIDLTVGGELAHDLADLGPGDAVQRNRARARLAEIDALAAADREIVPVDDDPVARLVDPHPVGALAIDRGIARHDIATAGVGKRGLRGDDGKPRDPGAQRNLPVGPMACALFGGAGDGHRVAPIEKKMRGSLLPSGVKRDLPGQAE